MTAVSTLKEKWQQSERCNILFFYFKMLMFDKKKYGIVQRNTLCFCTILFTYIQKAKEINVSGRDNRLENMSAYRAREIKAADVPALPAPCPKVYQADPQSGARYLRPISTMR
jgi:hypothetical protein